MVEKKCVTNQLMMFIYIAADDFKKFIHENFQWKHHKCINEVRSKVVGKINFKQK